MFFRLLRYALVVALPPTLACSPPPDSGIPAPSPREEPHPATALPPAEPRPPAEETAAQSSLADPPVEPTAPVDEEPYLLGGDIEPPVRLEGSYSEDFRQLMERRRGRWGLCIFQAVITREGQVEQVELIRPEDPDPELREAIEDKMRRRRYEPARKDGRPVAVVMHFTINHCPYLR